MNLFDSVSHLTGEEVMALAGGTFNEVHAVVKADRDLRMVWPVCVSQSEIIAKRLQDFLDTDSAQAVRLCICVCGMTPPRSIEEIEAWFVENPEVCIMTLAILRTVSDGDIRIAAVEIALMTIFSNLGLEINMQRRAATRKQLWN